MEENFESKWLLFEWDSSALSQITKRWNIVSKDENCVLGVVKWFGRWRGYAFFPTAETVFETQCLNDIALFIQNQNKAHREKRKKEKSEQNEQL